jgi:retron-type reverse transcriptase
MCQTQTKCVAAKRSSYGLSINLFELWDRLCSESCFSPPVRRVESLKANGGTRPLGIPTVADRARTTRLISHHHG